MSRMDQIETGLAVDESNDAGDSSSRFLRMGRMAMFFCIWSAMAIPVLLIISFR